MIGRKHPSIDVFIAQAEVRHLGLSLLKTVEQPSPAPDGSDGRVDELQASDASVLDCNVTSAFAALTPPKQWAMWSLVIAAMSDGKADLALATTDALAAVCSDEINEQVKTV